jgi:hypothetical protein
MDWNQNLITSVTAIGGLVGTLVTAVATFFLWRVTKVLANETTRMVEASSQPHIVATLDPNRRSMRHFDLNVTNTGNGTAYDILINFSPLLKNGEGRSSEEVPLTQISVLKPGQQLSSYLSEFSPLKGKSFTVSISWHRNQKGHAREENVYKLNMQAMEGISQLGGDPLIQISDYIKKMQADLHAVTQGSKRIKSDTFTAGDRLHERRIAERQRRLWRQQEAAQKVEATQSSPPLNQPNDLNPDAAASN